MPGFLITNMRNTLKIGDIKNRVFREMNVEGYSVQVSSTKKFYNDKLLYKDDNIFLVTEGVLLNSADICKAQGEENLGKAIARYYNKAGTDMFSELYGSYSGAIYDFEKKCWTFWTNHTGDSALFWYQYGEEICVATQLDWVLDTLKRNGILLELDESAAYSMLTYGYMCDERTYEKRTKRLFPGSYLYGRPGVMKIGIYWTLTGKEYDVSGLDENRMIDELDRIFREAVQLEFDKDLEYGYDFLADLSGGCDARMVNWVARDMGYGPITNIHYSQADSHEERYTKELAKLMGNMLILRPLDDLWFIYEIEHLVSMNYGLSLYSGSTGGESVLRSLNFEKYGLEHTGMIGDVVPGTFMENLNQFYKKGLYGLYSTKLSEKMDTEHINRYPNTEIQMIYIRALMGACTPYMIRKYYTESISPFMYPKMLEFCMSIPYTKRMNHALYNRWIVNKYPDAAKVKWTHTDALLTDKELYIKIKNFIKRKPARLLNKLKMKHDKYGMNPYEYWYVTQEKFRTFTNEYFNSNIENECFSKPLIDDMQFLFSEGTPLEKVQVLTVLAVGKLYFS